MNFGANSQIVQRLENVLRDSHHSLLLHLLWLLLLLQLALLEHGTMNCTIQNFQFRNISARHEMYSDTCGISYRKGSETSF